MNRRFNIDLYIKNSATGLLPTEKPGGDAETIILALSLTLVAFIVCIILFSVVCCILVRYGWVTVLCKSQHIPI